MSLYNVAKLMGVKREFGVQAYIKKEKGNSVDDVVYQIRRLATMGVE